MIHPRSESEGGTVLVMVTILVMISMGMVLAALATTTIKVKDAHAGTLDMSAHYVAEAGLQMQLHQIKTARNLASIADPFAGIDGLDSDSEEGSGHFTLRFEEEPLLTPSGVQTGDFDVVIDVTHRSDDTLREITITSIGYVPSKADFAVGVQGSSTATVKSVIRVALESAPAFDYSYFINHWGWFYGDTITSNGNVRANGQFDFGGYTPTINGSPRYESASGTDLVGYIDDNGDGLEDGNDGGVFAGWSVVDADGVEGMGGDSENQHPWQETIPMPNLTDLGLYEQLAVDQGGTVTVAGVVVTDGVLGDDVSEPQNLYLEGTVANPVVLNGPVVVRGDVIISGVVTGQGTIYAGRNAYIPGDLSYADGPTTDRPSANDQSTVEAWRSSNADKDALGLFAREHVVLGDYTHSYFDLYVGSWLNSPLNESREDAGEDGIHNTEEGPDGILGTSDDDVLEGDGIWTVDSYTAADLALGLIPTGKSVGDVIPGSGEDIDGDGVEDGQVQLSEFEISESLDPSNWAGLSSSQSSFSDISSIYMSHIDGVFYTNHVFAALMLNFGGEIDVNGAIISRNESIVYGADGINMNHDERLTGGNGASAFGFYLPLTWKPIEVLQWLSARGESIDSYVPTL